MSRKIRIGSRKSRLAVIQTELVMDTIRETHPEIELELITMETTGDRRLDVTLDKIGGKGLFVKELDRALLEGRIDLAVHSLKDMPMEESSKIPILGYTKREDVRDVLVLPEGGKPWEGRGVIGCSSFRRRIQGERLFPQAEFRSIRGNVLTRLEKLDRGEYDALILAAAGLKRLGLEHRICRYFSAEEILPAAGQGILAVQGRAGEDYGFLETLAKEGAGAEALAERAFVRYLDGGCSSPVAAYARVDNDRLYLRGLYYKEAIRHGASIVTDTQMARSGINKRVLEQYGGQVYCFMSDTDVAEEAKRAGTTRAVASMEKACALEEDLIFAIGNAPTALIRLYELIREGRIAPKLVIGAPVGFVNVVQSKEQILTLKDTPYIVARGRKGGSNIAACICNALLYQC